MTENVTSQAKEFKEIIADLPAERVREILDFAHFVRQRHVSQPKKGSAAAILDALQETGPLEFAEGELDSLLADIEALRQMDLTENGELHS